MGAQNSATGTVIDNDGGALPTVSIADAAAVSEGGVLSFTLTRTGDTTGPLTVNLGGPVNLPGGGAAGGFDYTAPTSVTFAAGSATAIVNVQTLDDTQDETNETVTLSIGPGSGYVSGQPQATGTILDNDPVGANSAPVVANAISDQSSPEDTVWNFNVPANAFSDVDGDALAYVASLADGSALPAWLTFNAATRSFSGIPPANFSGPVALKVVASDGSLSASDTFTLTVAPVNDPPMITSNGGSNTAAVSIAENTTAVTTVTATDPDVGQTLSYSISGGADASKFTIGSSTGALSFVTDTKL